jgi:hypothetical protein
MTFNNLHDGIQKGCDCLSQKPLSESTEDAFVRTIKKRSVSIEDFWSHRERGIRMRIAAPGCSIECQYRGVSMNKLDNNTEAIRSRWEAVGLISPRGVKTSKFVCTFGIKVGAGKIWDTSNNQPESHHTLLKADAFSLDLISVKEIIPASKF